MIGVGELSEMFHTEAHECLDELARVLKAQQLTPQDLTGFDAARRAAHNLKGAALTVGVQPIAGLCLILENEVHAQIESNQPPATEQIATWLYMVSEMQGIIDDPDIIRVQLHGFSDLPELPRDEPISPANPLEITSAGRGDAGTLAAQLGHVIQIQQGVAERAQSLQACIENVTRTDWDAPATQRFISGLRADLAALCQQVEGLGVAIDGLANALK